MYVIVLISKNVILSNNYCYINDISKDDLYLKKKYIKLTIKV